MRLEAESLSLRYGSTTALADASVAVAAGEVVALVGASGSGKTSLLYCLSRLVRPDSGSVCLDGTELVGLSDEDAARIRRHYFGFVFQLAELVPELTLAENVALPLELLRTRRQVIRSRVEVMLERLGIADLRGRKPDQVSGGQAQRAAVGRALIHAPSVVFADEPTGALDSVSGQVVLTALLELARDAGSAIVLVTHDDKVAAAADRRVFVHDGVCGVERPA